MNKAMIVLILFVCTVMMQCSMPVSVEEDNTPSIGQKNAELLQRKVDSIGDNLNAIHVYIGENLQSILTSFVIDGIYLIDKKGENYYNLNEMKALTVEEVIYSSKTQVIKVVF